MVVIGVDSHKSTHTAVAVDETGRKLAERTLPARASGHLELVRWAARFADRTFALEDRRHLSRRLSTDLLVGGETVVRVPPKLIAITRIRLGGPGRAYVDHRRAMGDTKTEAIRAQRRRISDEVFRRMRHDEAARAARPTGLTAAA